MNRKIPVLVEEDVYYLLQELQTTKDRDLSAVIRRLAEAGSPQAGRRQSIQELKDTPIRNVAV